MYINYSTHIVKSSSIFSILNYWMLLICQLPLTYNDNRFIYKMFIYFREIRFIKEGLVRFSCLQDSILNKARIHYIVQFFFFETGVEILGLGWERKHDLIHRFKVNKGYKFVLYMSKQSINFKYAQTSWFRELFLHFHTKKMISVHQHMAFVAVNRFCLLWAYINPHPLFLMGNVKLNGTQTKIKWKILALFTLHFKI